MPFLAEIAVRGSGPGVDEADQITEALAAAVKQGWQSRWMVVHEDADEDSRYDVANEDASETLERSVLDHRILGYPGGGFVLVVLGGEGLTFEEAALAAAELGRHITTWSPGLMACSVESLKVSQLERPYDEEGWLPAYGDSMSDTAPHFALAEHLDPDLQSLSAKFLLAGAVRSLWSPGRRVNNGSWLIAREIVLGAVEHPWGRELTSALGALLIKAARLEKVAGSDSRLIATEGGSIELATDLLGRTRATVDEDDDDWDEDDVSDDAMRGHELLEEFMEVHGLLWNRRLNDESTAEAERRSDRQLRDLLWAGLNTLATLCTSLRAVTNPWALLAEIDDDPAIAVLAGTESARIEEELEGDAKELEDAAHACALAWLALHRPEIIDEPRGSAVLEAVAEAVTPFHMLVYALFVMIGPGPFHAALAESHMSEAVRRALEAFARAHDATHSDDADIEGRGDAYDDMHRTLEAALEGGGDPAAAIREITRILHCAAELTSTRANPRRGEDGYISSAQELSVEMLKNAAMHATLALSLEDDEDAALRSHTLGLVAWVSPSAAGMLAQELPDLTGPDPRTEPAARQRALQWVTDALEVARQRRQGPSPASSARGMGSQAASQDALALLDLITEGARRAGSEWDIRRLSGAAAEAAASVLVARDTQLRQLIAVFADSHSTSD